MIVIVPAMAHRPRRPPPYLSSSFFTHPRGCVLLKHDAPNRKRHGHEGPEPPPAPRPSPVQEEDQHCSGWAAAVRCLGGRGEGATRTPSQTHAHAHTRAAAMRCADDALRVAKPLPLSCGACTSPNGARRLIGLVSENLSRWTNGRCGRRRRGHWRETYASLLEFAHTITFQTEFTVKNDRLDICCDRYMQIELNQLIKRPKAEAINQNTGGIDHTPDRSRSCSLPPFPPAPRCTLQGDRVPCVHRTRTGPTHESRRE